ncbi:MAG: hypothetical protein GX878_07710 [Firmicutes bacterium]|nr:hypothetical protein [Bacillota bacterium]
MKGKVITLKPRGDNGRRRGGSKLLPEQGALIGESIQEVERLIWRASARAPAALREHLIDIAKRGERICPALFLLVASTGGRASRKRCHLAASLESLSLALETHRDISIPGGLSSKKAILCGDFFFGLALRLASDLPLFIRGMSEVIARFADSTINITGETPDLPDQSEYLQGICDGSASIYALSCTLGASHGGLEPWQNEAFSFFGLYLGMGLQLKGEVENFKANLHEKKPLLKAGLPLIYILRESPLRKKLVLLLDGSVTDREHEILLKEIYRLNPWSYMEQIIGNCFLKANQFVELVHENIDPVTIRALKAFLC